MRRSITLYFLLIGLFTLYTGIHAQSLWPSHPLVGWTGILLFMGVMTVWQRIHRADQSDPESLCYRLLAWSGTMAMGIWATFLFFCLAADGISMVILGIQWFQPNLFSVWEPFLANRLALLLIFASGIFAFVGLVQAVKGPRIARVEVAIDQLPAGLQGLKIVLISDLHIGPTIRERYVAEVVERTLVLNPDLIAVTGDLADESVDRVQGQTTPLNRLKAPLGIYYVTGNHEYYWGVDAWLAKVRSLGWIPLMNENRRLTVKDTILSIAGIPDIQGAAFSSQHQPDMVQAAKGLEDSPFRLLLSHRPGVYAEAERAGFHLQLSGHTHGGQFFPWSLVIPFVHRYYKDLNRFRRLWIYVSPGTGYWGPPHRFLVPSEITLLELTAGATSSL